MGLAKLIASLHTNLRSLESPANFLLLAVEGFRELPNLAFSEECLERIHISDKRRLPKTELVLKNRPVFDVVMHSNKITGP